MAIKGDQSPQDKIPQLYVNDAHPLVWYLSGSRELSKNARECFEKAEKGEIRILIPILALFECLDKIARKGFPYQSIDEILIRIEAKDNFEIVPLDKEIFEKRLNLSSEDLMYIAIALLYDCPLITKDIRIRSSELVPILW